MYHTELDIVSDLLKVSNIDREEWNSLTADIQYQMLRPKLVAAIEYNCGVGSSRSSRYLDFSESVGMLNETVVDVSQLISVIGEASTQIVLSSDNGLKDRYFSMVTRLYKFKDASPIGGAQTPIDVVLNLVEGN